MPTNDHYDAIIIGAGQAGVPLSEALAKSGRRTAVIERRRVGGTCVNWGCTPTKTMVASAAAAYLVGRSADFGVHSGGAVRVDMGEVKRRKETVVEASRRSNERRITGAAGTDLIYGEASFTGPHTLQVRLNNHGEEGTERGVRQLSADLILINTGSRSARPQLPGLDDVPALNSTSIMELDEVPERLLILGGGYVGLEFGQMFCRFGSQVTIVQRAGQLLDREDADVADEVAKILRDDGIEVLLDAQAQSVRRVNGHIEMAVQTTSGPKTLRGSHLLVATGRTPNSDRLNLGAAGVETDERGFVRVNERLETSAAGVYALGDVKGGPAFTHISYDDFRIIRTNLIEGGQATTAGRLVPYVVYIDPQLGRVGLSETEARAQGRDFKVAKMPMGWNARAIETGETRGFMKALVDTGSGQILGCAVLGTQGGEIMSMMQIAMMSRLPYTALKDAVFAHPTLAESLNTLFSSL